MNNSYSTLALDKFLKMVKNRKLTRQQASDIDMPVFYKEGGCKVCGSCFFRTIGGECYRCKRAKVARHNDKTKRSGEKSLMSSIDSKLESIRLAKELRDYD